MAKEQTIFDQLLARRLHGRLAGTSLHTHQSEIAMDSKQRKAAQEARYINKQRKKHKQADKIHPKPYHHTMWRQRQSGLKPWY